MTGHRERTLHRRVVQPAILEATDPVDARHGQGEVELVVVAGHRLHRPDQMTVRVVQAEAVVDIDRGDVFTEPVGLWAGSNIGGDCHGGRARLRDAYGHRQL